MKILVIEDDPDTLQLAVKYLREDLGAEILEARTRKEALAALEGDDAPLPDILLSDIQLPDGNGIDLCQRIKSRGPYRNVPVIFMTAYDDLDNVQGAFAIGAIDFIVKPLDRAELKTRITNAMRLKQAYNGELEEKRGYARSTGYVSTWVSVGDDQTHYISPLVEDFSASGLRLVLPEDTELTSDRVTVLFSLPNRRDLLELKGTVTRRGTNDLGQPEIGLQFEEVPPEAREIIDRRARRLES